MVAVMVSWLIAPPPLQSNVSQWHGWMCYPRCGQFNGVSGPLSQSSLEHVRSALNQDSLSSAVTVSSSPVDAGFRSGRLCKGLR